MKGDKIYSAWLYVLALLLGLTLGWFLDICLGAFLYNAYGKNSFNNNSGAALAVNKQDAVADNGIEEFLAANPFRVSAQPVISEYEIGGRSSTSGDKSVEVVGSLASSVLRGTLPGVAAWLEDLENKNLKLVLVGASFDVYTLEDVTYREAVFVKDEDVVIRELLYSSEPDAKAKPKATPVRATRAGSNQPTGNVVAATEEHDGEVPSRLVGQLVQNPFDELKKVRLRPKDGTNGLQIQWIQDDSILKQLGVQKGDIIKSVNGIPFSNMGDIANSINSLMNSERFDVEVDRGGKQTALRYVVH